MEEGNLGEEIEVLEAIYIEELDVQRNDKNEVTEITLQLHPATGEDLDQRYVCMTLILELSPEYPNVSPEISIKNPRGIAEEELLSLREDMHKLCEDRKGGPVLYELIELAKDSLTAGNIPHCPCMICLEHFHDGDKFTKTECYHYFHEDCLGRYVTHMLTKTPDIVPTHAEPSPHTNKLVCPVCREEIHYKIDDFNTLPMEEDFVFKPSRELRELQAEMAAIFERQKAKGGIIDVEEERNKYLVRNDDVVLLSIPKVENKQKPDRPRSEESRYKTIDTERLKEFQPPKSDRDTKDQAVERTNKRPNSDYMRRKGRGAQLNENGPKNGREDRWRNGKKTENRSGDDTGKGSRERMKQKDEYDDNRGSAARGKQWKAYNKKDKDRSFGEEQKRDKGDYASDTRDTDTNWKADKPDIKDSGNFKEENVKTIDGKETLVIDNKVRTETQQAVGRNPKEYRGGFGKPTERRDNKVNEYGDQINKSRQNDQRRGGFGRPQKRNFGNQNYREERGRPNRGGFGKQDKDSSKELTTQCNAEKICQDNKAYGYKKDIEKEYITEESASSTEVNHLEKEKLDESFEIRDGEYNIDDRATSNREGFGRPNERRHDDSKGSSKNVNNYRRGGFGKPEKKDFQEERYREGRNGESREDFRKQYTKLKEKSEEDYKPSSGETASKQGDSKEYTSSPRSDDSAKDSRRHERFSGDSRQRGYWRKEDCKQYSRDEKTYRDRDKRRFYNKSKYGDGSHTDNREFTGSRYSSDNHSKYDRHNTNRNEESRKRENNEGNSSRKGRKESVEKNHALQRGGERDKGKSNNKSDNESNKYGSRNETKQIFSSEQDDTRIERIVDEFDKVSITVDKSKLEEIGVNQSVSQSSTNASDRKSVEGGSKFSADTGDSSDRSIRIDGPPGFTVTPPPGFLRKDKDSSSVVQPPPGFS